MSIDPSALDSYREFMGEEADSFVNQIVKTFLISAPDLISEMEATLANSDLESFVRAAHTLKSNSATFGATLLSSLCAEMEKEGKSGEVTGLDGKVSRARDELLLVLDYLKAQIQE